MKTGTLLLIAAQPPLIALCAVLAGRAGQLAGFAPGLVAIGLLSFGCGMIGGLLARSGRAPRLALALALISFGSVVAACAMAAFLPPM